MAIQTVLGSVWNPEENDYTNQAAGAVERTLQSRFQDVISAADFGFLPSETAANNLTALQAAIDYAKTVVSETEANKIQSVTSEVYMPSGNYNISGTLVVDTGVVLRGASMSATKLIHAGGSTIAISINKVAAEELFSVQFRDFTLEGAGATTTRGISGEDGANLAIRACRIDRCLIANCNINVFLDESFTFKIADSILFNGTQHNLQLKNGTGVTLADTRFDVSGDHNVLVQEGSTGNETIALLCIGCTFQSSTKSGFRGEDLNNVTFINNFIEANDQEDTGNPNIHLVDGGNQNGTTFNFVGGFWTPGTGGTSQVGIKIDRAQTVNINGIDVRGNGIITGVEFTTNVIQASVINSSFDGQATSIVFTDDTKLFTHIRGENPRFYGAGFDPTSFNQFAPQLTVGKNVSGFVNIGTQTNGDPAIQGSGTGTNNDLRINPITGVIKTGAIGRDITVSGSNQVTDRSKHVYLIDTSGGNRQITIQTSDIAVDGREFIVKKTTADANLLLVLTEGAETIDGAALFSSATAYATVHVISDGSNLFILNAT